MARNDETTFEQKLSRLREFRQDAEHLLARARQLTRLWTGSQSPQQSPEPSQPPVERRSREEQDRRRAAWTARRRAEMGRRMKAYWAKRRAERQKAA